MMKKRFSIKRNNEYSIEPEEILLDAPLYKNPFNPKAHLETHLESLISGKIFYVLFFVFLIGSAFILSKPFRLQFQNNIALLASAQKNYGRVYSIGATRGIIYDRNLEPLVANEPNFDVVVIPELLDWDLVSDGAFIEGLSQTFRLQTDWLANFFNNLNKNSTEPVPLAFNIDHEQIVKIETQLANIAGIRVEKNSRRNYVNDVVFSHILGYTGRVDTKDLQGGGFFPTDIKGKYGIELIYDNILRGSSGSRRFEVDARGSVINEVIVAEPETGSGLMLNIDAHLQRKLYETIEQSLLGNRTVDGAAAIALNPNNGEVLALVSWPGFHSNLFSRGISSKEFNALLNNRQRPLFNKVISGVYPPGSSIKPLVAAAALQENIIDPRRKIYASGRIVIPNPFNPALPSIFPDRQAFGLVDMFDAIAQSVNVYFYTIGGGYEGISGLGIDRIERYFRFFGFGSKSGIDIPSESLGLVPTPQWKAANKTSDAIWRIGDTYHVSIGQGDLLVTPLQIAQYTSGIANDGVIFKPRIAGAILNEEGEVKKIIPPEVLYEVPIDSENLSLVREAMRGTTTYGTAASFNSLPFTSAGKTGTAQFGPGNSRTHSWMTVFAPFESPEIVLVVLVEGGGDSGTSAVPINREVLRWYFTDRLNIATSQ